MYALSQVGRVEWDKLKVNFLVVIVVTVAMELSEVFFSFPYLLSEKLYLINHICISALDGGRADPLIKPGDKIHLPDGYVFKVPNGGRPQDLSVPGK